MRGRLFGVFVVFTTCVGAARAVVVGQVDTFQGGTVMGWTGGADVDSGLPSVISTGGPTGAGDKYLELVSGSYGGGASLTTYNSSQWAGGYNGAGVKFIEVDLRNGSASELDIRLVFYSQQGSRFVSNQVAVLPPDGQWRHFVFSLTAQNFVTFFSSETWANVYSSTNRLMFKHDPGDPSYDPTPVSGKLGIDNIAAVANLPSLPQGFQVGPGSVVSGGLSEIQQSDNAYLVCRPGAVLVTTVPPLQVAITSTSLFPAPTQIKLNIEAYATVANVLVEIYLYNYMTGSYNLYEEYALGTSDSNHVFTLNGALGQYVQGGTGQIKALFTFRPSGAVLVYPWQVNIDKVFWQVTP